jgi:beta-galactosidase
MFYFGVDYYPEQLPEECWKQDAKLMQQAGFNVVRLAEFAWSRLEPQDGVFDFDWLDRAIDILATHSMKIVLGTPTAATPPWLFKPEMALVDASGMPCILGSRREYCPNSATYRHYSVRITQAMAEHYRNNPNVIGWQIDNEFGDRCYCETCRHEFHAWLRRKFVTLDALNERWGTVFWSHIYSDWEQIPVPSSRVHALANPALQLDYYRFMSDTYVDYQQQQVNVLREVCPEHFVTHNFMGFGYDKINYFDLAQPLDLVSWDNYPRGFWSPSTETPAAPIALGHAAMRGLKRQNFWVMEQQSGPAGWDTVPPSPRPGELRLWAYQSIAHGADGVLFFRWQTAHFGAEQYWHGIIDHDGIPRRRYAEIKQMGAELQQIGSLVSGAEVRAEVALMLSYDARFAFQIQPNNSQFSYPHHVANYFAVLHRMNISVDIVPPVGDITSYKMLIVPALYLVDEGTANRLRDFVENGGTLVVTLRSGVKDVDNRVVNIPLPGLLAHLCGIEIEEYDSLPADDTRKLVFDLPGVNGKTLATVWCDVLKPIKADVLATYAEDYYAGQPAVTVNHLGKGRTLYVGTAGNHTLVWTITEYAAQAAQVKPLLRSPEEVEVTARWQGDRRLLFVLNHGHETKSLALDKTYCDLLSGQIASGEAQIPAKQVSILADSWL